MNKAQLRKLKGTYVRLQPPAKDHEATRDDDWLMLEARDEQVQLVNQSTLENLKIGYDHISGYEVAEQKR